MIGTRVLAVVSLGFLVGAQSLIAEAPFGYREHTLGSSVASVVTISGARATETRTLHERPARIQELDWRVPYGRAGSQSDDPVRVVRFSFYNDQLYRVAVTYDPARTEGLTNDDVVESLSRVYGLPLLPVSGTRSDVPADATLVARWEDAATRVTLTQGTYPRQYQLVLISKALSTDAGAAIKDALATDAQEAPQREIDRRNKSAVDARVAGEKARVINKAAFRP